jgi:hypothetical protein
VRSRTTRTFGVGRLGGLLVVALLASITLGGCGGTSGLRAPTRSERAQMVAAIDHAWLRGRGEPFRPCCVKARLAGELAHRYPGVAQDQYRPRVVSIRVSKRNPHLAVAAVEVLAASGRPIHDTVMFMLAKERGGETGEPEWGIGGGITFPLSCVPSAAGAVRELLCPTPWSILHDGAAAPAQSNAMSVGAIAPRWSEVALPGSVCGATAPIHLHWTGDFGRAYVRSVYWPSLPAVEVDASRPHLGESLGGEEAELGDSYTHYGYMNVDCTTGGGTGPDRLASVVVVFATGEHREGEPEYPLRFVGVITPQQPYAGYGPAGIGDVELTENIASRHGKLTFRGTVIVSEYWHGPGDPPDFPSGRATTIWTYSHGKLVSPRTVVDLAP